MVEIDLVTVNNLVAEVKSKPRKKRPSETNPVIVV